MSASTVYLIRSLGTVWGVSLTSAIVQNTLSRKLPGALSGVLHKWEVCLFNSCLLLVSRAILIFIFSSLSIRSNIQQKSCASSHPKSPYLLDLFTTMVYVLRSWLRLLLQLSGFSHRYLQEAEDLNGLNDFVASLFNRRMPSGQRHYCNLLLIQSLSTARVLQIPTREEMFSRKDTVRILLQPSPNMRSFSRCYV